MELLQVTNWTPSPDHIDRLKMTVNHLTNRRATLMETGYPLTQEQVIAIVSPPRMQEFMALGYDSLQTTHRVSYELGPEQGLGRRSITQVSMPRAIMYAFQRQLSSNYQERNIAYFNRDGIDDDTMEKLKQWTEKAVFERRLAMLTTTTVSDFFQHTDKLTMYHVMARWPGLKVAFKAVATHSSYYRYTDMWERYSNEVPRNLQRWAWPQFGPEADWYLKYQRRLALAEETLLSCVSLENPKDEPYTYTPRKLTAQLTDWQKLGGMPF
jgi:hypothetical protein